MSAPADLPLARRIADWAAALTLDAVPERVAARARLQAASMEAAALAGARDPAVRRVRAAARTFSAKGRSRVAGERYRLDAAGAVYANAAASIAHDWDDYLYAGHTGHSAVWAARAAGEAHGASADDVLCAQIAANEVAGRLGAALLLGPHNGQFWASIHCASAAVAAARAAGLDPERTAHAIGIALYQPPYGLWPGFMGPDSKLLTAAEPAAQGIRAAIMAAEGVTGAADVIEHPRGMLANLSFAPRPAMVDAFGEVWLTDTLAFKPRPGCAYLQTAVDAVLALGQEEGIRPGDVAGITVRAGWLTAGMERLSAGEPLTGVRVTFSVALSAAVALRHGRLGPEELHDDRLAGEAAELRDLAARVRVEHDWAHTLATLRGVADALPVAAQAAGVPLSRWLAIPRRMRELGMDELAIGLADLRALAGRPEVRGAAGRALRRAVGARDGGGEASPAGLAALDTARLRLPFPAEVAIRLRDGRVVEAAGRERGSTGAPLEEQHAVVAAKCAQVGATAPASWR